MITRASLRMLLVLVLCVSGARVFAQSSSGNIEGTITDASGAVVPNATITITNKATGVARTETANAQGLYSAVALGAGDYEVKVEVQGFKSQVREATVSAGGNTSVNMALTVGAASETVTVEAASAQINYESNSVAGVIDRNAVADLPLNGRSFMQLAVLEPGVTIASGSTAQFNALFTISVLGSGNRVAYTVDGGNISDSIDTGGGSASMNISQDVVQEFQLSSVNFDLATPISIGGAVNVVTRSGSNELHGSGYFYYRDHNMAAYPGLKRPTDPSAFNSACAVATSSGCNSAANPFFARRNPGFTVGGPLIKDKLFFFFNIEHTNQVQAIVSQAVGFLPNTVNALNGVYDSPYAGTQETVRFDYHLSNKHNLFARYSHDGNTGFGQVFSPQASPSNWVHNINWADQSIIGLTSAFTDRIVNDARVQYQYWSNHNIQPLPGDCVEPACLGAGLPGLLAILGTNLNYGSSAIGINPNAPQTRNTRRYEFTDALSYQKGSHRFKVGTDIMRIGNTGQWGFCTPYCEGVQGPGYNAFAPFGVTSPSTPITTTAQFYNLPFYSLGSGIFTGIGVGNSEQPPPYLRNSSEYENSYRVFAQDTWKARQNLTINYGIAWNAQTGFFTPLPASPFLQPVLQPLFGNSWNQVTPDNTKNFSPSVGFAYSPGKNGKTVIRGGGGIYWDVVPGYYHNRTPAAVGPVGDGRSTLSSLAFTNEFAGIFSNGKALPIGSPIPVGQGTNLTLGQFNQIYYDQIGLINSKLAPIPPSSGAFTTTGIDISKSAIEIFPPSYPVARSYQISAGVQRDLGYGMVLTADYAMRQGENLAQGELDYNLNTRYIGGVATPVIPTCAGSQLFVAGQECSAGAITFWTAQGRSRYNGLLAKLNKRMSNRYSFTASYQLAEQRASTGVQDLLNRDGSYAPTIPLQTFNLAGTVQLPWGFLLTQNMSAIGVGPSNVSVSGLYLPGTAPASTSGAEPLPTLPLNCLGLTCGQSQLAAAVAQYNTTYAGTKNAQGGTLAALALPAGNYSTGDGTLTNDFSLQKTFSVKERYKLMIIGQMFNAFNISNKSGYSYSLSSPASFGQPTARAAQTFGSAGPRALQLGARISF
jgi:hypothetical protein